MEGISEHSGNAKAAGSRCEECPFVQQPVVYGYGPPPERAKAVIIGEAPGRQEVQQGRPFVGKSGQLLRNVLEHVGLNPDDVYYTNVALCRPPGNKITPAAIKACVNHLKKELLPYVKAGVPIATAGATATQLFQPKAKTKIGSVRGTWVKSGTANILAIWHPAYILRAPSRIDDLVTDLAKLKNGPHTASLKDVKWRVIESVDEYDVVLDALTYESPTLCIDLETDQINWLEDKILCIGIALSELSAWIIPDKLVYEDETREFLIRLFDSDVKIVGHNFKFDMRFIAHQLGVHNVRCTYDTLIAHYVLNENERHALKGLLQQYFDIPDYEQGLVQRYLKSRNDRYSKVPRPQLYQYCAYDVCCNLRLWEELEPRLAGEGLFEQPFMSPLMASQGPLLQMELGGAPVDRNKVVALSQRLHTALDETHNELVEMCGTDFNGNSWQQVGEIMYGRFKMPKVEGRGFKAGSTAAGARDKIAKRLSPGSTAYIWLHKYGEWKSLEKLRSSYVDNLLPQISAHGRVHPDHLVYGTEVGRLSVRDPAIQTIPRPGTGVVAGVEWGKYVRGLFTAPEGSVIMSADYSQAEMRVAACLSGDEFLMDVYRNERDLHSEVAVAMFGPDYTKEQRVQCKMFNFSYLYGGTEYSFAADAGLNIGVARRFVRRYNDVMSGLNEWRRNQFKKLQREGYVEGPMGNRRRFPLITNMNAEDARKASVHAVVAGAASNLTLESLIEIAAAIKLADVSSSVRLFTTVHDSNILVVAQYAVSWAAQTAKSIMEDVARRHFPQIPWRVDVEVGPSWGELSDYL